MRLPWLYRGAWAHLQQLLAERFDKRPLIKEVAVTACMSYTAEPFFVPTEDSVMQHLRANGFTDAAYKKCLTDAVTDYAPWQESRLVLSVNPLRTALGQGMGDVAKIDARAHSPECVDERQARPVVPLLPQVVGEGEARQASPHGPVADQQHRVGVGVLGMAVQRQRRHLGRYAVPRA